MKVLLIGNGAREHALAEAIVRSREKPQLIVYADKINPGLIKIASTYELTPKLTDFTKLPDIIAREKPDFAVIGPEAPLVAGVADLLQGLGVPTFGPTQALAQLEGSKSFTRNLQQEYDIAGLPAFATFFKWDAETPREEVEGLLRKFMESLDGQFVVKADGLKSGKGVAVVGDHLAGIDDGVHFAMSCIEEDGKVVIEEKLIGEEFSLMFISDGTTLVACPAVQDHKRAFEDDKGPNTGGMGSYGDAGGSLPFLRESDLQEARQITEEVLVALRKKTGELFKGVMYGGFMATSDGVKLIEYNARFGDPEAMNVLPILKTDFIDLLRAVAAGTLADLPVEWENKATVVKYVVPEGYPNTPLADEEIKIFGLPEGCRMYYAAVSMDDEGRIRTSSSRAIGFVGIADTLASAERIAEQGAKSAEGKVMHRRDIGTEMLINRRVMHMLKLRK